MNFEITTSDGTPIALEVLNLDASSVWNKQVNENKYVNPTPDFINSDNLEGKSLTQAKFVHNLYAWPDWFNMIGLEIAMPHSTYTRGWANVKCGLFSNHVQYIGEKQLGSSEQFLAIENVNNFLAPYFELIDYWNNKGYMPKCTY